MSKVSTQESWFNLAARMIVRQNIPLRQACAELDLSVSSQESEKIFKSEAFQKILQIERNVYARELANTPGRDKTSSLGLLVYLVQKLIDEQQWDKAVVALEKLMKAEGWTGADTNVNVFAGLNAKEYQQLLAEIEQDDKKKEKVQ
jgi:hypothetical protein